MDLISRESATVCAPITAPGRSGVAVIRVSGEHALSITKRIAPFLPDSPESHRVYYGFLTDGHEELDEVLISYFAAGRSFTGDETLEISCHGSPAIQRKILSLLTQNGCLAAEKGEFSYRAFSNGRIDLAQAESILSLIHSQTDRSARLALRQLRGELSNEVKKIEDDLIWILANIEAGIDFTTEDIDVINSDEIKKRATRIYGTVQRLVGSYRKSRPVVDGLRVVFQGRPNTGKSSLLNALLQEDRAIVTDIAGTTRDIVEGELWLEEGKIIFADTAGLRETEDAVEKIGVAAALGARESADYIFCVLDSTQSLKEDAKIVASVPAEKRIVILNKCDLGAVDIEEKREELGLEEGALIFSVSAKTTEGLHGIKRFLSQKLAESFSDTGAVIIQERHFELLTRAEQRTAKGLELLQAGASLEFVALELQDAALAVFQLLGKTFDDQIMDRVFKEFCIGK
jgi:tRNA modification GTPase